MTAAERKRLQNRKYAQAYRKRRKARLKAIQVTMRDSAIQDLLLVARLTPEELKNPNTKETLGDLLLLGAIARQALRDGRLQFVDDEEV